ncbi:DMT family transporter [Tenacibaculum jejuense]|uniref:Putative permease, DMT superfamily n=1 Tax=Tenacibaculum jejuense TaxID=584609 RepID=A0A238U9N6_9FLAO|nr:DMT family transporter [Tenacibaculum jejuense]SNR15897.1 putative permease, DMT superfamily [Tenacibaculum jejuense]
MKIRNKQLLGFIIGILGIVLFSSKAVLVKLLYKHDVPMITALFLRMIFSFPFYVFILISSSKKNTNSKISTKNFIWILFFGFVGYYLASLFDFIGLTYIKASLERVILFVYPTIVLLFNFLFLKEKISKQQLVATLVTYIGIAIAFGAEVSVSGSNVVLGGFFVLLSAITYASYLVGSGWLIPNIGVVRFTSHVMLVSCICVFIHYAIISETSIFSYSSEVYILGFLIAILATVIPSFLVSWSIKLISSSNFAILASLGPVSTIILAVIFLDEYLSMIQLLGTLVVIIGVLLISRNKK